MAGDSTAGTLGNRERESWHPAHIDLVGSQTSGGADGIVVRKFDTRELFIAVVSELVDDHCQLLGYRVVYTFHPTVAVWVVGAGRDFSNPEKLIKRRAIVWSRSGDRCPQRMLRPHPQKGTYNGWRKCWPCPQR